MIPMYGKDDKHVESGLHTRKAARIKYHIVIGLLLSLIPYFETLYAQVRFTSNILDSPWVVGKPFRIQYLWEGIGKWEKMQIELPVSLQLIDSTTDEPAAVNMYKKQLYRIWTKTYTVKPTTSGFLTIPAVAVQFRGMTYRVRSKLLEIKKTAPEEKDQASPSALIPLFENTLLLPDETPEKKTADLVFIRIETNKRTCYVGEGIQAIYKLYTRVEASSEVIKRPSFHGFTVIDMLKSYDSEPEMEWWKGKAYYTHIIRKVHLFPLRAGVLSLDEAFIQTDIPYRKRSDAKSRFPSVNSDTLLSLPFRTTIQSAPYSVTVKPLPIGPITHDINTVVGKFSIMAMSDKPSYQAGELGTVRIVIQGEGNWPMVGTPLIQWPTSIKCMEPEISEQYDISHFPLKGEKLFLYHFIAADTGFINIPEISMGYFDPQTSSFRRARTNAINVKVNPAGDAPKYGKAQKIESKVEKGNSLIKIYFGILLTAITGWILYLVFNKKQKKISGE